MDDHAYILHEIMEAVSQNLASSLHKFMNFTLYNPSHQEGCSEWTSQEARNLVLVKLGN